MKRVKVIIPIYRGLEETQDCIESVVATLSENNTKSEVILINDASPEEALCSYLEQLSYDNVTLLQNDENLGFVGTVNKGMQQREGCDVILLNSDTEVYGNWIDRLQASAYSADSIATVTPFSNNATICSFPLIAEDNDLIFDENFSLVDTICSQSPEMIFDIPTGVGFCLYIKDEALAQLGLFDENAFGKGYGEENDFCQRAIKAGWRNILSGNIFVYHKGQTSFQSSRDERVLNASKILSKRYPNYDVSVRDFVETDPARSYRLQIVLNYIRSHDLPKILNIHQGTGGGVVRHIHELARFYKERAIMIECYPSDNESIFYVKLLEGVIIQFDIQNEFDAFIEFLMNLGISHVHFHHVMRVDLKVWALPTYLACLYDVTLHDFYVINGNPTLTHDGKFVGDLPADERDLLCKKDYPVPFGFTNEVWISTITPFLSNARYVLTPSADTAQRLKDVFSTVVFTPTYPPESHALNLSEAPYRRAEKGRPIKVLTIGVISPEKGANVIRDVAEEAAKSNAEIIFTIMGFTHQTIPHVRTTGAYKEEDADEILRTLDPDIIWLPAVWPETYSYTLSYAIKHALPVVTFALGAPIERLMGRKESYTLPLGTTAKEWVDWFLNYRESSPLGMSDDDTQRADYLFYHNRYLVGINAISQPFMDASKWGVHQLNQVRPEMANIKIKLLKLLLRVKRLPIISSMVDYIPLSFQKRIKRLLSRKPLTEL